MKYLGRFDNEEEAKECAKEKNGFVKKQTNKSKEKTSTFWYVYPRKEKVKGNK